MLVNRKIFAQSGLKAAEGLKAPLETDIFELNFAEDSVHKLSCKNAKKVSKYVHPES